MRIGGRLAFILVALTAWEPAYACTLCHSDLAEVVRARLAAPDFLPNVAGLLAPIPLLIGAIILGARN
jgi:hypothetical protein